MYITLKKNEYTIIRNNRENAEIETTSTQELNKIMSELIEAGENKILIDFSNVSYIDSSGLGVLLEAMKKLKDKNGEVGLLSISKDLLDIFTATKIAQYFKYYKIKKVA